MTKSKPSKPVVLLAHVDTVNVPVSCPVGVRKDRFYGNGSYDMKQGIVLFYLVVKIPKNLSIFTR